MNYLKYGKLQINPQELHESTKVKMTFEKPSVRMQESLNEERFLLPRIEAIHEGATRNNTVYQREKLRGSIENKSGVYSWLHPYPKPVIYNHDVNTKATGRIYTAAFAEYTQAGRPGIIAVPKITDPEAIEGILGERLLTVSIGATTDEVTCSICGTHIISEGFCGHMKGEVYDGRMAEWITENLWFDELSWVNVPADSDAMIVDSQSSVLLAASNESNNGIITLGRESVSKQQLVGITRESKDDIIIMEGELAMTEAEIQALKEELEALRLVKEELETAQADLESSKELVETLKNEKTALTEDHEKVLTEKEELVNSTKALEEQLATVSTTLTEKEEALVALTEEKETLTAALTEANEALTQTEQVTADLTKEVQESHINHLASLRIANGKDTTYEEAVQKLATRELNSVKDGIEDMKEELVKRELITEGLETLRQPIQQGTTSTQENTKKEKELSIEDALKGLFSTKRSN